MNKKAIVFMCIVLGIIILLLLHFGMAQLIPMIKSMHNGGGM